ncbi:MAG: transketolase [Alphaproteobacteria bacterium]|nr:transketolase [Alphaproteobacteria bacterium]
MAHERTRVTAILRDLEKKVLWLSAWTIHNANHLRGEEDSIKVGGHQASCASMTSIMTALYFAVLKPEDRVAVKPHASPVFHAIQYLLGNQTREKLEHFRAFGGAQSYPSRTKDKDDVDISTGSVGLGVAMTAFASLTQDYLLAKALRRAEDTGRMIALVGDAELDEGNIYECLIEGAKHGLRNTWWIIDYNRQSLDGVIREGLEPKFEATFRAMGWDVITLKYGHKMQAAFAKPGGDALKNWIDGAPNDLYSALTFQGGAAWRMRLHADLGHNSPAGRLIDDLSDDELSSLMCNLGGHDLDLLADTFNAIDHDRPVCFIAYTIKGMGLPLAGHKDNHSGLMTPTQMDGFAKAMNIREGHEWEKFEGLSSDPRELDTFLKAVPFNTKGTRRFSAPRIAVPESLPLPKAEEISTQEGFGRILFDLARDDSGFADRIVTTSPDVTVSTNLGGWVNRRGVFDLVAGEDRFKEEKIASTYRWQMGPKGQHIELGIAENNLFIVLAALGLSHSLFGERLLPIGTLYDPFIARGLDALNYACYQDARFILVATPSGVTLAPEGGAHQSIGTPLIGMAQDGLASFEPAFVDELAAILHWSFDYIQRDGKDESTGWLRDGTGGSVYLRLTTRPLEQPHRTLDDANRQSIIDGAYWLRPPGPNCEICIAYQGTVAPEAIAAAGYLAEDRRDVAVLAVTSADRLNAGWQAASRARMAGDASAQSHIDRLLGELPAFSGLVTVIDGHPATLSWLGSVCGHRALSLGVEHFGQSGRIADLYAHHGIDTGAILKAAQALVQGRPVRYL